MKKERRLDKKENFTKLTQKKGISLIVLIVTIIVIIILAAAVILTITKNNPVESAKEATFKEDVRSFQDELAMTVAKEYTDKQGQRDEKISTSDYDIIKEYIPSFSEKYKGKFVIEEDKLVGTDKLTENEKTWSESLNISTSGKPQFNADEWDKTATSEDCFLWEGNTIIGLNEEKLSGVNKIKIPSRCTAIRSDYAFLGTESYRSFIEGIEYVEIPDTVTSLGNYAFHDFTKLKSIEIPNSVTSIGVEAFRDCKSLTSITIPEGVTSIGYLAFNGCSSLTSVTIPEGVTSIGYGAFGSCSSLTSVTIPEGVTSIGGNAFFSCSSLTSITIPASVTSIGYGAFGSCSSLTSVTILEGVTSIGERVFFSCSSLTSINISDNNKNYSSVSGVIFNKDKTEIIKYPEGKKDINYIIPEGVTSIGDEAFDSCSSLTSVTIPEGVTSIGDNAFGSCSSLTSITIPASVTSIGDWSFSGCGSLTSVTIPEGVTSIGDNAFNECSSLTSITIPEGVTSIGDWSFSGCGSLTSVTIPEGVTSIGYIAFNGCSSLTNITYIGTQSQWKSINKNSDWKYASAIKTITCTDGVIRL